MPTPVLSNFRKFCVVLMRIHCVCLEYRSQCQLGSKWASTNKFVLFADTFNLRICFSICAAEMYLVTSHV